MDESNITVKEMIHKMTQNDHDAIISGIHSDIPILNLNAIIYGTRYKYNDPEFIDTMKLRFADSKITFFGMELSEFVSASLHLLGVQEYAGDDLLVKNLIRSQFDFDE